MITALDSKTALVVIDLQKGIVAMQGAHPASGIVAKTTQLIEAFHKAQRPVVIVNVDPFGGNLYTFRIQESMIPADEEKRKATQASMAQQGFFDIIPELPTNDNDIFITKNDWSAFTNPDLHKHLQELEITGLVMAGIATSIGVEGTARSAHDLGYNLTFASDAMTDRHQSAHDHSITLIFPRLGEVDTTEAILKYVESK